MNIYQQLCRIVVGMILAILVPVSMMAQDSLVCEDASGCDTDTVTVSILMSNPVTPVSVFTINMSFPDDILDYTSCVQGTLVPSGGWILFGCNSPSANTLSLAGFGLNSIPAGSTGTLVELTFTVNCPTCFEGQNGTLDFTLLEDDVASFVSTAGTFTYTCITTTPTPTETPIPTDTPTNTPVPTDTPTNTPVPTDT
ncbi:hypothetical protein JXA80_05715, partial [bacterium]|nr:hypothetical protein [candidate division CSSED10-310 bacterium]